MADYRPCFEWLANHEGYHSNDPNDAGGETFYGICQAFEPDDVAKMRLMTQAQAYDYAKAWYKKNVWDRCNLDACPDQGRAFVIFASYVNPGPTFTSNTLQKLGRTFPVAAFIRERVRYYTDRCVKDIPENCNVRDKCRCCILVRQLADIFKVGDASDFPSENYLHSAWLALDAANNAPAIPCPPVYCPSVIFIRGWLNGTRDLLKDATS
jgi:hypothetical protein